MDKCDLIQEGKVEMWQLCCAGTWQRGSAQNAADPLHQIRRRHDNQCHRCLQFASLFFQSAIHFLIVLSFMVGSHDHRQQSNKNELFCKFFLSDSFLAKNNLKLQKYFRDSRFFKRLILFNCLRFKQKITNTSVTEIKN